MAQSMVQSTVHSASKPSTKTIKDEQTPQESEISLPVKPSIGNESEMVKKRPQEFAERRSVLSARETIYRDDVARAAAENVRFLVTAEGGEFELKPEYRVHIAATEDGVVFLNKSDRVNPLLLEARDELKRKGYVVKEEHWIDVASIKDLYDRHDRLLGRSRRRKMATPMQDRWFALLAEVAAKRASDVHLFIQQSRAVIRVRMDGVMKDLRDLPVQEAQNLAAAAFNMADAADAMYRPLEYQGARINRRDCLPPEIMSVRLQFNPLPDGGRYMVARILYRKTGDLSSQQAVAALQKRDYDQLIRSLGYRPWHLQAWRAIRRKPFGVAIVAGPTGSGKSTTLERILSIVWRERAGKISLQTVEDPPEYIIEGAAQFPVVNAQTDEERREKFRQAITAVLRSDPDIVMIGEIRDSASAKLCFQAAMTGHPVYTTLHANDALSIVPRLIDIGVEQYKIANATLCVGLVAQRLLQVVCPSCGLSFDHEEVRSSLPPEAIAWIEALPVEWRAGLRFINERGCEACGGTGVVGRSVVAETIVPDDTLLSALVSSRRTEALEHWIKNMGGITMAEHGVLEAINGKFDLNDIDVMVGSPWSISLERLHALVRRYPEMAPMPF